MNATAQPAFASGRTVFLQNLSLPAILGIFTLVSRVLCRGPVYFADGPNQIVSILTKSYIVQPPGYWLFDRIAGLFTDPALAITCINIACSVAGVVVFYYLALLFTSRRNAFLAALTYSTIFYIWFSAEIHSTYATQIIFAPATFLALLDFDRRKSNWKIGLAALLFSVGSGLRPTDGFFLLPMLLYFAAVRMTRKSALLFLALSALFSLGWIVPTWIAFSTSDVGMSGFAKYVGYITTKQSLFTGFRLYTLANPVRFALPVFFAFWPLLGIVFKNLVYTWRDWRTKAFIFWILPGSAFFTMVLMACAPYLNYLTAAVLLLVLMVPRTSLPKLLAITALWNAFVFLVIPPIPSQNFAVNVLNSFVLRCTRGGVEQQYNTILTDTMHLGTKN